jgi:predicted hydrocarbon binding protein
MARRTALLHYYFSKTVVDRLGEEEGKKLIKEAIWAYGQHCGRAVREGVQEMGLPITDENFYQIRDLPKHGWETDTITLENGDERRIVTYCPLAATFKALGPQGEELGRLYCTVDQAKYQAYDPEKEFVHARNVLDGDACCEFVIRPVAKA